MNIASCLNNTFNFICDFAEDMAFGYLDDPTIAFYKNIPAEDYGKIVGSAFQPWNPKTSARTVRVEDSPESRELMKTLPGSILYKENPTLAKFNGKFFEITVLNYTHHFVCFDKYGGLYLDGFQATVEHQSSHTILYTLEDRPDLIFLEKKHPSLEYTYKTIITLQKEDNQFIICGSYGEDPYRYQFNKTFPSISEKTYEKRKIHRERVFTLLVLISEEMGLVKDIIKQIAWIYEEMLNLEFKKPHHRLPLMINFNYDTINELFTLKTNHK